jgi:RNA polymerase sigma-70 factor, ECF subfamily
LDVFAAATDSADDVEMIGTALNRLDADGRELVELKIYAGLTFREIAEVVDRPAATVATQYRRALESLRSWLTKQYR